jgi:hypothetical protein
LRPFDVAEDAGDAAIAGRRPGIVRMAGEADLVALGDRDDALEEVVDALPVLFFAEDTGEAGGGVLVHQVPAEGRVARAAAAGLVGRARDADEIEIVFDRGDAGRRDVLDEAADGVDLAVAVGAVGEDVGALRPLDHARGEGQLHHVEDEAAGFEAVAVALQRVEGPVVRIAVGVGIDMADAQLGKLAVFVVRFDGVLRSDVHRFPP